MIEIVILILKRTLKSAKNILKIIIMLILMLRITVIMEKLCWKHNAKNISKSNYNNAKINGKRPQIMLKMMLKITW